MQGDESFQVNGNPMETIAGAGQMREGERTAIDKITCNFGGRRVACGPLRVIESDAFVTNQFRIEYPATTNVRSVATKCFFFLHDLSGSLASNEAYYFAAAHSYYVVKQTHYAFACSRKIQWICTEINSIFAWCALLNIPMFGYSRSFCNL